jgi:hypothetical protein
MRILPIPPTAKDDPNSIEMVRGWIIDGKLTIALSAWVWKDKPETWGQFLADAAGHVADAISKELGSDRNAIYAKIRDRLVQDLEESPRDLSGDFVDRTQ